MGKTSFKEWAKNHQEAIIFGTIIGGVAGVVGLSLLAVAASNGNPTPNVSHAPIANARFGPDIVTDYDDIPEAIFADLAPTIEKHVLNLEESGKITIERIYDITEPYFDGAWGGRFSAGELGDLFARKVVTVTIEDVVGD